jgi:hypothetical protein
MLYGTINIILKKLEGGVQMNDILHYAIPYGFIGTIANSVFVGKEVNKIFAYREKAIERMFGAYNG